MEEEEVPAGRLFHKLANFVFKKVAHKLRINDLLKINKLAS